MRVHDVLVRERHRMADLLDGLTAAQWDTPSLCRGWSVRDVAAHLTTYLRFGQAKIYLGIVATGADFDRWNIWLTRRAVRGGDDAIVAALRRRAGARTTIPRSGYDPVLADLVVHDLDVRIPLGLPRDGDGAGIRVALRHLAERPSPGFAVGERLRGLRLEAADTGWAYGSGALVRGPAEALLLAMAGRAPGLDGLSGDGLPMLSDRLARQGPRGPVERLGGPLRVLLSPPPAERRSRDAQVPV